MDNPFCDLPYGFPDQMFIARYGFWDQMFIAWSWGLDRDIEISEMLELGEAIAPTYEYLYWCG